jgi:thiol-disulfide isomerase/thioredoxin
MKLFPLLLSLSLLAPALAQAQTVRGRVVGAHGEPLAVAHAHLRGASASGAPLASVACDREGRFSITIPDDGYFQLELTGIDHQLHRVPLLAGEGESVEVEVQLAANNLPERPEQVLIIGDFNDWSFRAPMTMERRADGTFAIEIATGHDSVAYQVMFPIGEGPRAQMRSVNGTHASCFVYDGGGDYRSVVAARDGVVEIVFDPRRTTRSAARARVAFADPASRAARYAALVGEHEERRARFYGEMKARMAEGNVDVPLENAAAIAEAARAIESESDDALRAVAMVQYLSLTSRTLDASVGRRALSEIAPSSAVWQIDPAAVLNAVRATGDEEYFEELLEDHASESLRAQLLFERLVGAHFQEDSAGSRRWYERLTSEFGEHELSAAARRAYDPDRTVRRGVEAPAFTIASLDGEDTITNASLEGRYVLIDFWATWCMPCLAEMQTLHDAYDRYGGDGLAILSLSFDAAPELVVAFRDEKWKMPWMHAFVEGGFESPLAEAFEVSGIPRPILLDPSGRIVAIDAELRGARLEQTLARLFGSRDVGNR